MKKSLILFALAAVGLASCNGGFKKGDAGVLYDVYTNKSGPKIKSGDFVSFNLIVKTDADSILVNTYDMGNAVNQPVPPSQAKNDLYACMGYLTEGDSATFKVSLDSIFKKQQRPPQLKGKYIIYQVKIDKVIAKDKLTDQVFQGRVQDFMKTAAEGAKKAEEVKMKKYITDHNLKVTTTASGLNYVITKPGTGDVPAAGDTVEVYYAGRFTTNKIFETNFADTAKANKMFNPMNPYKPIKLVVGMHQVIPGWDEGLLLLNKGAMATFVIPSKLAYGEQGFQQIQPFTPMVFNIELVNIIKPDPNAPKPPVNPLLQQLNQQRANPQQAPQK